MIYPQKSVHLGERNICALKADILNAAFTDEKAKTKSIEKQQ